MKGGNIIINTDINKQKIANRKRQITNETKRLVSLYEAALSSEEKEKIIGLIENAAFLRIALKELREIIQTDGFTEIYNHGGGQSGNKESASVRTYNNLLKSYNLVFKSLSSLATVDIDKDSGDFINFISKKG